MTGLLLLNHGIMVHVMWSSKPITYNLIAKGIKKQERG